MLQRLSSVVLVVSRCDPEYVDSLLALVSPVDEEPELAVVSLLVVEPELAVVSLLVVDPEPAVVEPLLVVVPEPDVLLDVVVELEASHAPL